MTCWFSDPGAAHFSVWRCSNDQELFHAAFKSYKCAFFFSSPFPAQFAVSYIFAKRLPTGAKYSLLFHRIQQSTLDNFLALLQNIAAYTFANSNTVNQMLSKVKARLFLPHIGEWMEEGRVYVA